MFAFQVVVVLYFIFILFLVNRSRAIYLGVTS